MVSREDIMTDAKTYCDLLEVIKEYIDVEIDEFNCELGSLKVDLCSELTLKSGEMCVPWVTASVVVKSKTLKKEHPEMAYKVRTMGGALYDLKDNFKEQLKYVGEDIKNAIELDKKYVEYPATLEHDLHFNRNKFVSIF